jgi:uncharacterized protein
VPNPGVGTAGAAASAVATMSAAASPVPEGQAPQRELHLLSGRSGSLCFDVAAMRLYQLSRSAAAMLETARAAGWGLGSPAAGPGSASLGPEERRVLEELRQYGLLQAPRAVRPEPVGFEGLSQLGVMIDGSAGTERLWSDVASAVRFLLSGTELPGASDLVLHAGVGLEAEPLEVAVEAASEVAREADQLLRIALRTPRFPLARDLLEVVREYGLAVEVVISDPQAVLGAETVDGAGPDLLGHALATIVPSRMTAPVVDLLAETLPAFGFRMIDIGWRCALCRAGSAGRAAGARPAMETLFVDEMIHSSYWLAGSGSGARGVGLVPALEAVLTGRRLLPGCHAGRASLVCDRTGWLYPCHEVAGDDRFRVGDLASGVDRAALELVLGSGQAAGGPCSGCWARHLCGGPGPLARHHPGEATCDELRRAFEAVLAMFAELGLDRRQVLKATGERLRRIRPYLHPQPSEPRPISSPRLLRARGDSMEPMIREGDRLLVRGVEPGQLRAGDIVAFGRPLTCHRLVAVLHRNGEPYGVEQGDAHATGTAIPLRLVVGRVEAIERGAHQILLTSRWRRIQARLVAARSLVRHLLHERSLIPAHDEVSP